MQGLMDRIAIHLHEGGEWCSLEKAHTMACLVAALRPQTIVEIGVWMGGSLIPIAMAAREAKFGHVIAIDPWSKQESVKGQNPTDANWWGQVDHDTAYKTFVSRIAKHNLQDVITVWRQTSNDAPSISNIGLLHIDGNHSEQAHKDAMKYGPNVNVGGIVVMDDIGWSGGGVAKGVETLRELGFLRLYDLGSGAVFQRMSK